MDLRWIYHHDCCDKVLLLIALVMMEVPRNSATIFKRAHSDSSGNHQRIRLYLEDDETLLVPKNSVVHYIRPVFPPTITLPAIPPPRHHINLLQHGYGGPPFNMIPGVGSVKPHFGFKPPGPIKPVMVSLPGVLVTTKDGEQVVAVNQRFVPPSNLPPISVGLQLKQFPTAPSPIEDEGEENLDLGDVNFGGGSEVETSGDVKPVTEDIPDDLVYDFRTQQHHQIN